MAHSEERLGLARSSRLKRQSDFAEARAQGQRCVSGCLIANVRRKTEGANRVGVITSKKIGGAVQRSRARRLLRESFRLHQRELEGPMDVVLVARASIANKKRAEVEWDYLRALRQTGALATRSGGGSTPKVQ